jgi:hypothetical protein
MINSAVEGGLDRNRILKSNYGGQSISGKMDQKLHP